jgi:hypothetical protein
MAVDLGLQGTAEHEIVGGRHVLIDPSPGGGSLRLFTSSGLLAPSRVTGRRALRAVRGLSWCARR